AYEQCAERLGLHPVIVPAAAGVRPIPLPVAAKGEQSRGPTTTLRDAPSTPTDTIPTKQLMDGRPKNWTGDWTRGEGTTSSIEFSLTFNGEKVSGRVRWAAASGKQDQQQYGASTRLSGGESDVFGTFDPRRLEIQLRAEKSGPGDPAA